MIFTLLSNLVFDVFLPLVVRPVRGGVCVPIPSRVSPRQLVLVGRHQELAETGDGEDLEGAVARLHQLREPLHRLKGALLLYDVKEEVGRATSTQELTEFQAAVDRSDQLDGRGWNTTSLSSMHGER